MSKDVRLPPGVRDFLPEAAATRRRIAEAMLEHFERWGYQRIITPQFECADVLERGLGPDNQRAALRFVEPESGEVVALRPDITPQIARIAATRMGDIEGPLRLCYEGAVIRRTGGAARNQREILQVGVELLGAPAPSGDGEMAALAAEILAATRIHPRRLEVGHVGPVRDLLASLDPPVAEALEERLALRDLSGAAALASEHLDGPAAALATILPRLAGSIEGVRSRAAGAGVSEIVGPAIAEIESVIASARTQAPAAMDAVDISIDLGEIDGFPYYTGIRLAGWLDGVGSAVLVGGRYDHLVARYGGQRPATGFALDIELVAEADGAPGRQLRGVLVAAESARSAERAQQMVAALRRRGLRAALELGGLRGRGRLRAYAGQSGFDRVLVIGPAGGAILGLDGAVEEVSKTAVGLALRGRPGKLDRLLEGR